MYQGYAHLHTFCLGRSRLQLVMRLLWRWRWLPYQSHQRSWRWNGQWRWWWQRRQRAACGWWGLHWETCGPRRVRGGHVLSGVGPLGEAPRARSHWFQIYLHQPVLKRRLQLILRVLLWPPFQAFFAEYAKRTKRLYYPKSHPKALRKSKLWNAEHAEDVQQGQEATPKENEKTRNTTYKTEMHTYYLFASFLRTTVYAPV